MTIENTESYCKNVVGKMVRVIARKGASFSFDVVTTTRVFNPTRRLAEGEVADEGTAEFLRNCAAT
jgi:hypothetical protein